MTSRLVRVRGSFGVVLVALAITSSGPLSAQRPDTARKADSTRARTSTAARVADSLKPPISPRRAFRYSALVPGSAQAKLGRNRAAAVMLAVEAVAIAMIRESGADVREARRMSG